MACPDELTLDLWLADALPSDEAAAVAAHVRTCATCAAAAQTVHALGTELQAALALDAEELAYLSGLALASPWRTGPAAAALSWGWIALAGVVGGYAAWLVAAPVFGSLGAAAAHVGLGTVPLHLVLGLVFGLGQALLDLTRHPALGLSQPSLALLALALLVWPHRLIPQRSTRS
jgi:anti-sigma factor RsiW